MKRSTRLRSGGKPEKSKYARKQEELATGARDPFEFSEEARKPEGPAPNARPKVVAPLAQAVKLEGVVSGKLALLAAAQGYFFIETEEGVWIHVGLSLLKPHFVGHKLSRATVVTCETEHRTGARNPRATIVHSVVG